MPIFLLHFNYIPENMNLHRDLIIISSRLQAIVFSKVNYQAKREKANRDSLIIFISRSEKAMTSDRIY